MTTLSEQSVTPSTSIVSPKERICPRCCGSSRNIPFYVRKNGRLSNFCIECEKKSVSERYENKKNTLSKKEGNPCKCGCGELTSISVITDRRRGLKAGDPQLYINGHGSRLSPFEFVVEDRGYKTPCWIWQRAKDDEGYGFITVPPRPSGSRSGRAHVVYYERKFGPIPKGLVPDHLCRVHSCVNPDHIEPVTVAINTRRGDSAKLNNGKVLQIRERLGQGEIQDVLADQFGVSQTMISRIKLNKAWRGIQ